MSRQDRTFEDLMKEGQSYLGTYLYELGLKSSSDNEGVTRCPNSTAHTHGDKTPSANVYVKDGKPFVKCHKCEFRGDVYDVHALETGRGSDSSDMLPTMVREICEKYHIDDSGVKYPGDELTEEDIIGSTLLTLIEEALLDITKNKHWSTLKVYAEERGFTADDLYRLGVYVADFSDIYGELGSSYTLVDYAMALGLIKERKEYSEKRVKSKLNNLFNSESLTFVVRNQHGKVKGFSRRYMQYDKDSTKSKYNQKYYNSGFTKSSLLYMEDKASYYIKDSNSVIVVEGFLDAIRLHSLGIRNAVAIMGAGITESQLSRLYDYYDIDSIYLAIDRDQTGITQSKKFIDAVISHPRKIIDLYILMYQVEDITITDVDKFILKLTEHIDRDALEEVLYREYFKHWIVWETTRRVVTNKSESLTDLAVEMASNVAKYVTIETTKKEVLISISRICGVEVERLQEYASRTEMDKKLETRSNLLKIVDKISRTRYKADPDEVIHENQQYAEEILDILSSINNVNSPRLVIKGAKSHFQEVLDSIYSGNAFSTFKTGFKDIDEKVGIPKIGKFIGLPGRENSGKSAFFRCLATRLLHHNPRAKILYFSLDDTLADTYFALISAWANTISSDDNILSINTVKDYAHVDDKMYKRKIERAIDEVKSWVDEGRLALFGADSGTSFDFIYKIAATAKAQDPEGEYVIMVDNFYDIDGAENDDGIKRLVKQIKGKLIAALNIPVIVTMEMRKPSSTSRSRGHSMSISDIRETGKIGYILDLAMMVYTDMHNHGPVSQLTFDHRGVKRPVVEIWCKKNKITDFKGMLMYKFYTNGSYYEEIGLGTEEYQFYDQIKRKDTSRVNLSNLDPLAGSRKSSASSEAPGLVVPKEMLDETELVDNEEDIMSEEYDDLNETMDELNEERSDSLDFIDPRVETNKMVNQGKGGHDGSTAEI